MPPVDPVSDATLIGVGRHLWARNEGRLWCNINASERVLMAYYWPAAAWAASDDALKPCSVLGRHRA